MMRLLSLIIVLSSLILASCDRSKTATELIQTFYDNEPKLTTIVNNIQNNKILDSLLWKMGDENGIPDIKANYPEQYKMLEEVGITDASAHYGACAEITIVTKEDMIAINADNWRKARVKRKWYYLKTNWQSDHPVFLIYNECDTATTRKGFYKKDERQNETWGLGDNWAMFRLVKSIEGQQ